VPEPLPYKDAKNLEVESAKLLATFFARVEGNLF